MQQNELKPILENIAKTLKDTEFWKKVRSYFILVVSFFSLAFLFIAPFEMWSVAKVRNWDAVPAQMLDAGFKRASFSPHRMYASFTFIDLEHGKEVITADVRPGDFPMSMGVLWFHVVDSASQDVAKYPTGANFMAYRSPDGKKYYLEQGDYNTMSMILLVCGAWWLMLLRIMRSRKTPKHSPNSQN